jgi:hypothetical protein
MLLRREPLGLQLKLVDFVLLLYLLDFRLKVLLLVLLQLGFVLEPLVLRLNVAFDLRNVLLRLGLGVLLEVFEQLRILVVDPGLLPLQVLGPLLLHVQQLAQQGFVLLLDILELLLLDQPIVFELQKPLLLLN